MDKTVLLSMPVQDFQAIIVDCVNSCFKHNLENNLSQEQSEQLLTREETCDFLKINSSTLWAWTNSGKVNGYGIGSRRYYKRSELLSRLAPLKTRDNE